MRATYCMGWKLFWVISHSEYSPVTTTFRRTNDSSLAAGENNLASQSLGNITNIAELLAVGYRLPFWPSLCGHL